MAKRNQSELPPLVYEIKDEYTEVHYNNEFGRIGDNDEIREYEWIISKFFEEKIPIELLMTYANFRADSFYMERDKCYFQWYPIESICERLIAGENDDAFKQVYYNQLIELKKLKQKKDAIIFATSYKEIFITPEPFTSNEYIQLPYEEPRLAEAMKTIQKSSEVFALESLTNDLYLFVGPWKKRILSSDLLEISEFAHLIRIAKNCGKITKDNSRVKLIRSLVLERAISFFNAYEDSAFKKINECLINKIISVQNEILPINQMKKSLDYRMEQYEDSFESRFDKIAKYYKQWSDKNYIDEPGADQSILCSRIIDMYFIECIQIEDIIIEVENELKKIKRSRKSEMAVWEPIYAIIEQLIKGENPENIKIKHSGTMTQQSISAYCQPRKSHGASQRFWIERVDFWIALDEISPSDDLKSIISIFFPVPEGYDYGSEMTLCFQLANDVNMIYEDEQQRNLLACLLLERALSFPAQDIAYFIENSDEKEYESLLTESEVIRATNLMNLIEKVRIHKLSIK